MEICFYIARFLLMRSLIDVGSGSTSWTWRKKIWETVKTIGDRVFFLGQGGPVCSGSCSANNLGWKANYIYYIKDEDTYLYCFDMDEGTLMVDHVGNKIDLMRNNGHESKNHIHLKEI